MDKCVHVSNSSKVLKTLPRKMFVWRELLAAVVVLFLSGAWTQSNSASTAPPSGTAAADGAGGADTQPAENRPAQAGPVADTVLSPLGGYGTAPPPYTSPYDFSDFAPVTALNNQLPRWIQFGLEERIRWESYSGGGFKPGNNDSYFLNRLRFGMSIQPASWFKVIAQFQDARPIDMKPPVGPPNEVRWDLKQAYVELGASETSPVSIRVGRQIIDYNSTIFGNSEWRNQARSFDAAVMNIHVDRYRLGIFAASVVNPLDIGLSHHLEGNNVYGLYGGIETVIPKSVIEPFVLWRVAPSVAVETTAKKKTGELDEKAFGFRLRGSEIHNFDYRVEVIGERGYVGTNNIRAWATTFGAGYRFASLRGVPRIFGGYDYASGDKNPTDGIHNTFDLLYPNAHDRFGIADQFGWQNVVSYRGGASVRLHRRLTVVGQYLDFSLAEAKDGIYNISGGLIARDKAGKSGTHVGESFETYAWYELNRRVSIGAGIAHILPGTFLAHATKGAAYTYPYVMIHILDGKRLLEVP